jgi:hypothetical protein
MREAPGFDSLLYATGTIDCVNRAHVIAMPVLLLPSIRHANAQRCTEKRRFDIVNRKGIARKNGVYPAAANQSRKGFRASRVHDNRPGNGNNSLSLASDLAHDGRRLPDRGLHLAFRRDLITHEGETPAVALLRLRNDAYAFHANYNRISGFNIAETAATGSSVFDDDHGIHALIVHIQPYSLVPHLCALVRGGVEIFRSTFVAFSRAHFRVSGLDGCATQTEQLRHQLFHLLPGRYFDTKPQFRRIAVRAADTELLYLEAAACLHHRIEDLLHDVGVNEVTLRFYNFGNGRTLFPG